MTSATYARLSKEGDLALQAAKLFWNIILSFTTNDLTRQVIRRPLERFGRLVLPSLFLSFCFMKIICFFACNTPASVFRSALSSVNPFASSFYSCDLMSLASSLIWMHVWKGMTAALSSLNSTLHSASSSTRCCSSAVPTLETGSKVGEGRAALVTFYSFFFSFIKSVVIVARVITIFIHSLFSFLSFHCRIAVILFFSCTCLFDHSFVQLLISLIMPSQRFLCPITRRSGKVELCSSASSAATSSRL